MYIQNVIESDVNFKANLKEDLLFYFYILYSCFCFLFFFNVVRGFFEWLIVSWENGREGLMALIFPGG